MKKQNYTTTLQKLIAKGVATKTVFFREDFTIKLPRSNFSRKPVTCKSITLRPILIDRYFAGDVILTAKTEACVGKHARKKEQHNIKKIKSVPALEALVRELFSKDEAKALAKLVK